MRNDARNCRLVVETLENRVLLTGCAEFGAFFSDVADRAQPFGKNVISPRASGEVDFPEKNFGEHMREIYIAPRCELPESAEGGAGPAGTG